jgi:hypothetical protein
VVRRRGRCLPTVADRLIAVTVLAVRDALVTAIYGIADQKKLAHITV